MNKKIFAICIVLLGMLFALHFAVAGETTTYEVATLKEDVEVDGGMVNLAPGVLIGGNPENSITLKEDVEIETTEGTVTFKIGDEIDCDEIPPGEPDPCDPY